MPYVLTVDQRASRRGADRVGAMLERLNGAVPVVLAFERTAGDEFQGVLADPVTVVDTVLELVRAGGWSIGVGAGAVDTPLPRSTRAPGGRDILRDSRAEDAAMNRPAPNLPRWI